MKHVLAFVFLSGLVFTATAQVRARNAAAENGRRVFMKQGCFRCHGTDGQGGGSAGPRLAPDPPPVDVLINYVRKPSGQMPPYRNQVSDEELRDIQAYLATIPPPPQVKNIPLLNQ